MKSTVRYNHCGEDLTKRSAYGKVLCAGPNRFRAVSYAQQIHYLDPDTKRYELIDNTLIKTDAGLTNKANGDMRVTLLPEAVGSRKFNERVAVAAISGAITGGLAATGIIVDDSRTVSAVVCSVAKIIDLEIKTEGKATAGEIYLAGVDGLFQGFVAGTIGGNGTATRHMQSAFRTALNNRNWRYFQTQVYKEAVKAGKKAVRSIMKSSTPAIAETAIKYTRRRPR